MAEITPRKESDHLGKRYERRAKVIAWVTGLGLPLLAGGMFTESANARAAGAASSEKTTHVDKSESMSEGAFLSRMQSEMMKISHEVMATQGVKPVKGAPSYNFDVSKNDPTKSVPTEIYYIVRPNKTNTSHHDVLAVTMAKGQKLPLSVNIGIDEEAYQKYLNSKPSSKKGDYGASYSLSPIGVQGEFTTKELGLIVQNPTTQNFGTYLVGPKVIYGGGNKSEIEFLVNPASVTKEYESFFNLAQNILDARG